jgi:hypothetical protein
MTIEDDDLTLIRAQFEAQLVKQRRFLDEELAKLRTRAQHRADAQNELSRRIAASDNLVDLVDELHTEWEARRHE